MDLITCSSSCELPSRRLASLLGNEEAALLRFTTGKQAAVSSRAAKALSKPNASPMYAAGGRKLPIMLASVKVSFITLLFSRLLLDKMIVYWLCRSRGFLVLFCLKQVDMPASNKRELRGHGGQPCFVLESSAT